MFTKVIIALLLSTSLAFAGSEHFSREEFACKHCGIVKIDPILIEKLELLRAKFNKPIIITSGYRCEKHNKNIGGVSKSQHIQGKAADIKVYRFAPFVVAAAAKSVGFTFTKVYSTWTHIDIRGCDE